MRLLRNGEVEGMRNATERVLSQHDFLHHISLSNELSLSESLDNICHRRIQDFGKGPCIERRKP